MLYIAITLLLGFAAVNTGNNLLFLIVSALLGFMVVSGIMGVVNLGGVEVRLLPPEELYAGTPALVSLTLVNRKRLPSFLLTVSVADRHLLVPFLAVAGEQNGAVTLTFNRRGRQVVEGIRLGSSFPINFFVRSRPLPSTLQLTVFPTPRTCGDAGAGEGRQQLSGTRGVSRGTGNELERITDYAGEPLRQIHWRLTARHDQLKVKQLVAEAAEPVIITLDELPGGVEERLSCATFLVNRFSRQGRGVGLKLGELQIAPGQSPAHRLHLLTELANHGTP
ncbi:MAG TPA: DUF58 domain-containing protein [Geobacterales bacterium]|nr:DUF58 domain-containing protein [Geobacterales bacterium]